MSFDNLTIDMRACTVLCRSLAATGPGSLGAARLACRGLRDLVDGGVTELKLELWERKLKDLERWCRERGRPFRSPLLRWPMVQRLDLILVVPEDWGCDTTAVSWVLDTLHWLFAGVPPACLARITVLAISHDDGDRPSVPSLLAALPPQLPGLKTLDITECCDPVQPSTDRHVFATLATRCPALEDLALPEYSFLDGIEALGGLRRLRISWPVVSEQPAQGMAFADASWQRALSGLQQLRQLTITFCHEIQLGSFLALMPPDVETLELRDISLGGYTPVDTVRMQLAGGRLQTVEVEAGSLGVQWEQLDILAEGLLEWAALGPQLPRLRFSTLNTGDMGPLDDSTFSKMRQLLRRCTATEVAHLLSDVSLRSSTVNAGLAMQLFGTPRTLSLRNDSDWDYIAFDIQPHLLMSAPSLQAAAMVAAAAAPGLALGTVGPQQVWEEAVRRVREAAGDREGALAASAAGSGSVGARSTAAGPVSEGGSSSSGGGGRVVLLCGAPPLGWRILLDRLPAKTQRQLLTWPLHAIIHIGSSRGVHLPHSSAVLVGCSSLGAAEALVVSLAATATDTATDTDSTSGVGGESGPGVEAFLVPYDTPNKAVLGLLKPVLQDLWASSAGGGGASVQDRVERLVELMRGIGDLQRRGNGEDDDSGGYGDDA